MQTKAARSRVCITLSSMLFHVSASDRLHHVAAVMSAPASHTLGLVWTRVTAPSLNQLPATQSTLRASLGTRLPALYNVHASHACMWPAWVYIQVMHRMQWYSYHYKQGHAEACATGVECLKCLKHGCTSQATQARLEQGTWRASLNPTFGCLNQAT